MRALSLKLGGKRCRYQYSAKVNKANGSGKRAWPPFLRLWESDIDFNELQTFWGGRWHVESSKIRRRYEICFPFGVGKLLFCWRSRFVFNGHGSCSADTGVVCSQYRVLLTTVFSRFVTIRALTRAAASVLPAPQPQPPAAPAAAGEPAGSAPDGRPAAVRSCPLRPAASRRANAPRQPINTENAALPWWRRGVTWQAARSADPRRRRLRCCGSRPPPPPPSPVSRISSLSGRGSRPVPAYSRGWRGPDKVPEIKGQELGSISIRIRDTVIGWFGNVLRKGFWTQLAGFGGVYYSLGRKHVWRRVEGRRPLRSVWFALERIICLRWDIISPSELELNQ